MNSFNFYIQWLCTSNLKILCPRHLLPRLLRCVFETRRIQTEKPWLHWIAPSSSLTKLLNSSGTPAVMNSDLYKKSKAEQESVSVFSFKFYTWRTYIHFKPTSLILAAEPFSSCVATENSGKMFDRGLESCSTSLRKAEVGGESVWPLEEITHTDCIKQ